MKNLKKKKRIKPQNRIEELGEEMGRYKLLESVALTEGGKELVSLLLEEIAMEIDNLVAANIADQQQLPAIVARIDEKLSIIRKLTKASDNVLIIKEALSEEEERRE